MPYIACPLLEIKVSLGLLYLFPKAPSPPGSQKCLPIIIFENVSFETEVRFGIPQSSGSGPYFLIYMLQYYVRDLSYFEDRDIFYKVPNLIDPKTLVEPNFMY